jgi:peroxiredoxin
VAVSFNQSPERVKLYAAKHKLPYEVLFDRSGNASDVYDVPATSYVVVLDRAGKVVYTGQGGDQNIDAAVRKAM